MKPFTHSLSPRAFQSRYAAARALGVTRDALEQRISAKTVQIGYHEEVDQREARDRLGVLLQVDGKGEYYLQHLGADRRAA